MFTGIISHLGKVELIKGKEFSFSAPSSLLKKLKEGSSIAVNGVCLTIKNLSKNRRFSVDLMPETLKRSSFGSLRKGDLVNLELPLGINSRFDGHIVQGHIDNVGRLQSVKKRRNSQIMTFKIPKNLSKYIVEKGSIAVNGISLTVISVSNSSFAVGIIQYTCKHTMMDKLKLGNRVNIEVDILAKYVEKLTCHVKKTH